MTMLTRLGPRKAPLRVTPDIIAVREVIRLLNAREARGEAYKQTKRALRELLLKLLREANE
jgi:hypothetical protein